MFIIIFVRFEFLMFGILVCITNVKLEVYDLLTIHDFNGILISESESRVNVSYDIQFWFEDFA
jgi:hypothetical protein